MFRDQFKCPLTCQAVIALNLNGGFPQSNNGAYPYMQGPLMEFSFVVLSFLLKKNIRFHIWDHNEGHMLEANLVYDMSPEQIFTKLVVTKESPVQS
jgi:hypothetical protein